MGAEEKWDDAVGKAKEGLGKVTGDKGTEAEGKAEQAKAGLKEKAEEAADKAKEKAGEAADKIKDVFDR
ncbi:CsbD family protein [Nocardiopsis sp. RSe5-2]|uniref:CsbD family protein n=1 Tax=Nocardiopsis endophytica TaxID=3018445 RepID=A0ABT4UDY4_9ACTN|nr:CsbD family protein [Nocardiopsis endophytica]MDA2814941.1 CsbD family protein [Nocardiopsis endophytica]